MPNKINAAWHAAHKMPQNPTLVQRIEWHMAHAKACSCRPVPPTIKAWIKRGGGTK